MHVPRKVGIFLASPEDVQPEREAAERIVRRLGGVYAKQIKFDLERWGRRKGANVLTPHRADPSRGR